MHPSPTFPSIFILDTLYAQCHWTLFSACFFCPLQTEFTFITENPFILVMFTLLMPLHVLITLYSSVNFQLFLTVASSIQLITTNISRWCPLLSVYIQTICDCRALHSLSELSIYRNWLGSIKMSETNTSPFSPKSKYEERCGGGWH